MFNVFFIFSRAKKDEENFNKYATKSVEEKQRMYKKFDVHTKYFFDQGFSFTKLPEYSKGHKAVKKACVLKCILSLLLCKNNFPHTMHLNWCVFKCILSLLLCENIFSHTTHLN